MLSEFLANRLRVPRDELNLLVEFLWKITVLFIGLAYAAGLIMVNLHLSQYGIFDVGLARVEYVLAGGLYLILMAYGVSLLYSAIALWRAGFEYCRDGKIFAGFVILALSLVLVPAARMPFDALSDHAHPSTSRAWIAATVIVLGPLPFWLLWKVVAILVKIKAKIGDERVVVPLYAWILPVFILPASITFYAYLVYPYVLPIYGGGRATRVRLILASDATAIIAEAIPAGKTPNGLIYEMISETSDWIVIGSPEPSSPWMARERRAVRIPRTLVRAVVSGDVDAAMK